MIRLTALILFFLLASQGYATPPLEKIQNAIVKANDHLKQHFTKAGLSLPCTSTNPEVPCQVDNVGVSPFALYFTTRALEPSMSANDKQQVISLLAEDKTGKLFVYASPAPVDSDDVAFALQTEHLLGKPVDLDGLSAFYKPKLDAYSTFITNEAFVPFTSNASSYNNIGIHPEVMANLYNLFYQLHKPKKINASVVKYFQKSSGFWPAYFYDGKYYSTYMNMKLLCALEPHSRAVHNGIMFILHSQHRNHSWGTPGNPLDTSFAILTLSECKANVEAMRNGVQYLLSTQNNLGYWDVQKPLWTYVYSDNPSITWIAHDDKHMIATSLAVMALRDFVSQKMNKPL